MSVSADWDCMKNGKLFRHAAGATSLYRLVLAREKTIAKVEIKQTSYSFNGLVSGKSYDGSGKLLSFHQTLNNLPFFCSKNIELYIHTYIHT